MDQPHIRFSAIGLSHDHIYGQVNLLLEAGAELVSFYAQEPELVPTFVQTYPQARQARSAQEILEDETVHLIVSAGIPCERAPLGIAAMRHGKDFMSDKPGFTTLEQLAEARRVQAESGRIYSICFSERLQNRAAARAGELVQAGAIGRVVHTVGLGPHRIRLSTRPDWFFRRAQYGGIITDIGSHQVDQFLFFTSSVRAEVVAAQVANYQYPQYPELEDLGEVILQGNGGTGYIRVDWFTPDGLETWGDGRLVILGTEGYIELRKYCDIAGRPGGNHLFLVDQKGTHFYPHQMWLDGIYMAAPFYAEFARVFGEPAGFDDVAHQITLIEAHTRDPTTGLLYHGWDESRSQRWADPETGCSPHFWGRAMGWYAMAIPDVLDHLPEDHPRRESIIAIFRNLVAALAAVQDQPSGLWYQVLDQGHREGNYLEAQMKYFASLESRPGLNGLPYNPCQLLDFGLLKLAAGEQFSGQTGEREVLAVILGGQATFEVAGKRFEKVGGRPNVFAGKPHSVYLPAGIEYRVTAEGPIEIGMASAPSDLQAAPYVIPPERVANGVWGAANFRRYFHQILTLAAQPDLPARRLIVGETFTPSGNWSTFPPHRHEVDDLPREADHEEMYFFKVSPADGFGICRYYADEYVRDDQGEEANFTVRDNTILMAPHGYHTVVSAPGYTTYYLWFLAGEHRIQATVDDPHLGWVSRTVPMLRELGH